MTKDIFLKLTFDRNNDIEEHILLLDTQAQFNLAAAPAPRNTHPRDLIATLIHYGAVWNDVQNENSEMIPALQRFNSKTGQRHYLCHYRQGFRQDPAPDVFAEQYFNAANGKPGMRCRYNDYNEDYQQKKQPESLAPILPDYLTPYVLKNVAPAP